MQNKNDDNLSDINPTQFGIVCFFAICFTGGCALSKKALNDESQQTQGPAVPLLPSASVAIALHQRHLPLTCTNLFRDLGIRKRVLLSCALVDGAIEFCAGIGFMSQLALPNASNYLFLFINSIMFALGFPGVVANINRYGNSWRKLHQLGPAIETSKKLINAAWAAELTGMVANTYFFASILSLFGQLWGTLSFLEKPPWVNLSIGFALALFSILGASYAKFTVNNVEKRERRLQSTDDDCYPVLPIIVAKVYSDGEPADGVVVKAPLSRWQKTALVGAVVDTASDVVTNAMLALAALTQKHPLSNEVLCPLYCGMLIFGAISKKADIQTYYNEIAKWNALASQENEMLIQRAAKGNYGLHHARRETFSEGGGGHAYENALRYF